MVWMLYWSQRIISFEEYLCILWFQSVSTLANRLSRSARDRKTIGSGTTQTFGLSFVMVTTCQERGISLGAVTGINNKADLGTKALDRKRFNELREMCQFMPRSRAMELAKGKSGYSSVNSISERSGEVVVDQLRYLTTVFTECFQCER